MCVCVCGRGGTGGWLGGWLRLVNTASYGLVICPNSSFWLHRRLDEYWRSLLDGRSWRFLEGFWKFCWSAAVDSFGDSGRICVGSFQDSRESWRASSNDPFSCQGFARILQTLRFWARKSTTPRSSSRPEDSVGSCGWSENPWRRHVGISRDETQLN